MAPRPARGTVDVESRRMRKKKGNDETPVTPAPDAPAPPVRARRTPRVSSPVEIAAALRQGDRADATGSAPAAPLPVGARDPDAEDDPFPTARQDIESYATVLQRRLEASAPALEDEGPDALVDSRPLRERIRDHHGLVSVLMFRIGHELFATDLASVDEAVELPEIHRLPEMPVAMLGAFDLRGRLTPVYSPAYVIGVPLRGTATAALLVRSNGHRIGLAVDDVEDVLQVDLATVREAPGDDGTDGLLLGVAHHGAELVALLDAESLVAGCVTGTAMESA